MRYEGLTVDGTKGGLRGTMDKLAMMSDQITLMKHKKTDKIDDAISSILNSKAKTDTNGVKNSSCGGKKVKTASTDFGNKAAGDPIMQKTNPGNGVKTENLKTRDLEHKLMTTDPKYSATKVSCFGALVEASAALSALVEKKKF